MSNPFALVRGVTVVSPVGLLDAANELTAAYYETPSQRGSFTIPLAPAGASEATHFAGSWGSTNDEFWTSAMSGSLESQYVLEDWMDEDLMDEAYDNWSVYDPAGLLPDAFSTDAWAATKIVMIPRRRVAFAEALAHLIAVGLDRVAVETE